MKTDTHMKLFNITLTLLLVWNISIAQTTASTDSAAFYPTQIIGLKTEADSLVLVPLPPHLVSATPVLSSQGFKWMNAFTIDVAEKTFFIVPRKIITTQTQDEKIYTAWQPVYSDGGGFILFKSPGSTFENATYIYNPQIKLDFPERVYCNVFGYAGRDSLNIVQVAGNAFRTANNNYIIPVDSCHRNNLTNCIGSAVIVDNSIWGIVTGFFNPSNTQKVALVIEPIASSVKTLLTQSQR